MKNEKPKQLKIKGSLYAKYLIEGDVIYLKMIKEIIKGKGVESENDLVKRISAIEGKKFSYVAYLNIK